MESHYIYFNNCEILDYLKDNFTSIRDEFLVSIEAELQQYPRNGTKANYITDSFNAPLYTGKLKCLPLLLRDCLIDRHEAKALNWGADEKIRFWPARLDKMPTIAKWITQHLDIIGGVTFNISTPGSKLNHHYGLDNNYLRLHLVLMGAKGCEFNIENEIHEWVTGEIFGFDDANVFHGTRHWGTTDRIMISFDVKKSALKSYAQTWPVQDVHRPKITIPSDW